MSLVSASTMSPVSQLRSETDIICNLVTEKVLSRVRGSVTNNSRVLDWKIGFTGSAITVTLNYNQL
jgi:hypothetical protein